ncbi:MAG TPA: GNAT family N-acetyltransferase, partial [Acidimicrobiales bacterium]|nr:GNAT family N-acetyltransferase [Acidimicrobiales bacterium]
MGRRIEELWPLSGLRVRTGPLELRPPSDDDVAELAELTREPIHDPATMPFFRSWTDEPEERRVRSVLQWNWRARAEWSQEEWHLVLAVAHEGTLVGCQGIQSKQFAATKEVETGSWLGRRHQGQGIGTAMRRAVLHLAFAGLGAETARSGAFFDNPASQKVSERLGYE